MKYIQIQIVKPVSTTHRSATELIFGDAKEAKRNRKGYSNVMEKPSQTGFPSRKKKQFPGCLSEEEKGGTQSIIFYMTGF